MGVGTHFDKCWLCIILKWFFLWVCVLVAVPPVVPELLSDDDATHFDDIPEPDSGEEFFPIPKVHKIVLFYFYQLSK